MNKKLAKTTILIVDDEPDNLQLLTVILASRFHIKAANNGVNALAIAKKQNIDIILLDILMPEMDGFDVLRQLKENPQTCSIPVILITASDETRNEEKGLRMGAADYIYRPFEASILKLRIDRQLQMSAEKIILEGMASTDYLTQIPNRSQFDTCLEREWRRASRTKIPFSVAMIDIDYFKQYNDAYGHNKGDEALISIAELLQSHAKRAGDVVGRWGGEEFSLLLLNVDEIAGEKMLEEIRKDVIGLQINHTNQPQSQYVSVSAGGATCVDSSLIENPATLIRRADRMLYEAKKAGKNCVLWYQ